MNIRLQLLKETANARLYRFSDGQTIWIPRSVCTSTTKFPAPQDPMAVSPDQLRPEMHELNIEDWWWEKWLDKDEDD